MNYSEYMSNIVEVFPTGVPIFTENIVKTISAEIGVPTEEIKSIVNLNLKRLADDNAIERIQKGVYYKPKMTAFGKTKPPFDQIINETCIVQNNTKIGYIGGETLLHDLGLTSLIPKNRVIVTNKYRTKLPQEAHTVLKKSVIKITDENARYLQIIDAIAMLDTEYVDANQPEKIIRHWVDKFELDRLTIIKLANRHYPQRVLFAVLETILEDNYDITH